MREIIYIWLDTVIDQIPSFSYLRDSAEIIVGLIQLQDIILWIVE